jgi:hypothetical protein
MAASQQSGLTAPTTGGGGSTAGGRKRMSQKLQAAYQASTNRIVSTFARSDANSAEGVN